MPETKTQRSAAGTAPRRTRTNGAPSATKTPHKKTSHKPRPTVEKTDELSKEVLESVETGQREAITAVRKFMASIDKSLPLHGEGPSKRQEVIDSAMEMTDRLVHTQYDFLRKIVHSAGKSLNKSDGAK